MAIVVQTAFNAWTYKGNFDSKPTTSSFVSKLGGKNDEVHIAVVDEGGLITGTAGHCSRNIPISISGERTQRTLKVHQYTSKTY